ncbi:hypothetical protein [Nocardia sp. AG03]|uniref:hypothetical protein n=1 Tax=Nocardia sp. AG03 TaxID=3025312 RepID=UPI0024183304|nr:hypothetical protein [Nocardia sp. AG03]
MPLPPEEFRAAVTEQIAPESWVADGAYHGKLGSLVWERADTVVWFDLPKPQVMAQIVRRSVRRVLTREELWNGNREWLCRRILAPFVDEFWRHAGKIEFARDGEK